ncbi:hypothetical protein FB446DRAFT_792258 [Lentinula raphanica]|nr:hypothetical protein FB446DRAFT_792258 [Lentinula raphanica]
MSALGQLLALQMLQVHSTSNITGPPLMSPGNATLEVNPTLTSSPALLGHGLPNCPDVRPFSSSAQTSNVDLVNGSARCSHPRKQVKWWSFRWLSAWRQMLFCSRMMCWDSSGVITGAREIQAL